MKRVANVRQFMNALFTPFASSSPAKYCRQTSAFSRPVFSLAQRLAPLPFQGERDSDTSQSVIGEKMGKQATRDPPSLTAFSAGWIPPASDIQSHEASRY